MNMTTDSNINAAEKFVLFKENFKVLLEKEEGKFNEKFERSYSKKNIEEYSLNEFNSYSYIPYFYIGNIFFFFMTILFASKMSSENIYTLSIIFFLIFGTFFFAFIVDVSPVKKILNKYWLKKEKNRNSIKKKMFMNNVVDKSILKIFADVYGKKALKKIFEENESVKYKNIISYISNHESIEEKATKKEEKSIQIDEIIECIISEK